MASSEAKRHEAELQALVRIARTILQHTTLDDILSAITAEIGALVPFERSSVALVSKGGGELVLRHICRPGDPTPAPGEGRRVPMDERSVIGWVALHREPVLRCDIAADARFREVVREEGLRCDMIAPIVVRDRVIGTLNVGSRRPGVFEPHHLSLLCRCAELTGAAIEHVQLLEEARELTERYRTLQRRASDMILLLDRTSGRVLEANEQCARVLGWTEDEIVGKAFFDLVPEEDRYQARRDFIDILSGKCVQFDDRRMVARDGSLRFVDISAGVMELASGPCVQLVVHDVSQRRILEQQIVRQNRRLEAANRTLREVDQMKTEFLANISHELRTPLSVILAYTDSLRSLDLSDEDRLQFLDVIADNGRHLIELVDDLLDLSRLEVTGAALHRSLAHVHDAIRSIWPRARDAARSRRVEIAFRPGDDVPAAELDVRRIRQVFSCLVHNAIKFTEPGGSVEVVTERRGDRVRVEVRDTGAGIPPEQLPRIFETFRQGDGSATRRHGGLGIGLAMARHIVELHGGTIGVESEVGRGSTFHVELPGAEPAFRDQTPRERESARAPEAEPLAAEPARADAPAPEPAPAGEPAVRAGCEDAGEPEPAPAGEPAARAQGGAAAEPDADPAPAEARPAPSSEPAPA